MHCGVCGCQSAANNYAAIVLSERNRTGFHETILTLRRRNEERGAEVDTEVLYDQLTPGPFVCIPPPKPLT